MAQPFSQELTAALCNVAGLAAKRALGLTDVSDTPNPNLLDEWPLLVGDPGQVVGAVRAEVERRTNKQLTARLVASWLIDELNDEYCIYMVVCSFDTPEGVVWKRGENMHAFAITRSVCAYYNMRFK